MQLKVKKAFKWAHRHVEVQDYTVGDVIDTQDEELIRVATEEGWATQVNDTSAQEAAAKAEAEAAAKAEAEAAAKAEAEAAADKAKPKK